MKKFLAMVVVMMVGVSAFALDNFNWQAEDNKTLDAFIQSSQKANEINYLAISYALKNLIGKNFKNITYEEFKKTCAEANKTYAGGKHPDIAPAIVLNTVRFKPFCNQILNDDEFKNLEVVKTYYAIHPNITPVNLRKLFILDNGYKNVPLIYFEMMFDNYLDKIDNYSDEEVKADLKKLKRYVYPKISDEKWKAILIKIELTLKSVE